MQPTPEQTAILDHPADSIITLHSHTTGRTYTYRIRRAPLRRAIFHYVDLLTGTTNESQSFPLGRIVRDVYHHSPFSDFPDDSLPAIAFAWYWRHRNNPPTTISIAIHENSRAA